MAVPPVLTSWLGPWRPGFPGPEARRRVPGDEGGYEGVIAIEILVVGSGSSGVGAAGPSPPAGLRGPPLNETLEILSHERAKRWLPACLPTSSVIIVYFPAGASAGASAPGQAEMR